MKIKDILIIVIVVLILSGGFVFARTISGIPLWLPNDNDSGIHPRDVTLNVLIGGESTTTDDLLEVQGDLTVFDDTTSNRFCVSTSTPDCISSWGEVGGNPFNQWLDSTSTVEFDNLTLTGYASSTTGLFTQGSSHIGGDLSIDGTLTNGTTTDALKITNGLVGPITNPVKNYALLFDGTKPVWAAQGTSFTFSINIFVDNQSSSQEIGTGEFIAIGATTFTASYNNGPATSGSVQIAGGVSAWASALTLTGGSFLGPTASVEAVPYPANPGTTITFRLTAGDGIDSDTQDVSITLNNLRFWGVTSKTDTYTEADVEGLAGSELSNSKDKSFSNTTGSGEYALWASRTALGTVSFTVGGFEGGFQAPETVSITNGSGFTEDFYVYRSTNSNLGTITIVAD